MISAVPQLRIMSSSGVMSRVLLSRVAVGAEDWEHSEAWLGDSCDLEDR